MLGRTLFPHVFGASRPHAALTARSMLNPSRARAMARSLLNRRIQAVIEPLEPRLYLSAVNPVGSYIAPPSFLSSYQQVFCQDFAAMTSDAQAGISSSGTMGSNVWIPTKYGGGDWNDFISEQAHDQPFGIDGSGAGSNYLTMAAYAQTGTATLTSFTLAIGGTTYYQDGFTGNSPLMGELPSVVNTNGNNWTMTQNDAIFPTSSLEGGAYILASNATGVLHCPANNEVDGGILPVNTISGINSGVTLDGTKNFTLTATFTNPTRGTVDMFLSSSASQSSSSGSYSLQLGSGTSAGVTSYQNGSSIGTGSSVNATNSVTVTLSYTAGTGGGTLSYQVNGQTAKSISVTTAQVQALQYVGFDFNNNGSTSSGMWNDWTGNYAESILSSMDGNGTGFAQKYGYFEASIETPGDSGYANNDDPNTWPSFWMVGQTTGPSGDTCEIDVTESYGNWGTGLNQSPAGNPNYDQVTTHDWNGSAGGGTSVLGSGLTTGFHTYGVDIEPTGITYYLDRQPIHTDAIFAAAQVPMVPMLDLALGGGNHNGQVVWKNPATGTTNTYGCYDWNLTQSPSDLKVQYVAVYASPNSPNYVATAPGTPAGLIAAAVSGVSSQIDLAWTAVGNAVSYNIYRSTISGAEGTTPLATNVLTNSYSDTGLTAGTAYYYTVAAVNTAGTSTQSSQARATTQILAAGGLVAIGVQFVGSGSALGATTSAGASDVAQTHWNALTGSSFSNAALKNNSGTTTAVTLSGSASGTYSCASSFASGTGNHALASGELYQTGTFPPSNSLTFANISYPLYNVYVYGESDASGRATTFSLTAGGVTSYYSFLCENSASTWTLGTSTWNGSGSAPSGMATANYVEFTGLTASSFVLKFGAPGNGAEEGVQIVDTPPSVPSGLTATPASPSQINLSWNPVAGAVSYNVYRGSSSNGEGATPIATGITGTTYPDSALTAGSAYYYTVAAVNTVGTGSQSSEAIATTAGNPPTVTGVYVGSTAWNSSFISYLTSDSLGNSAGYLVPSGGAQWSDLPWVNLNQISISFSENINLSSDALTLVGVNQAGYTPSGFTYNSGTQTATWTLPSALGPDKLIVSLSAASVSDGSGNQLAGSWTNGVSTYPSTGAAGTDLDFRINVVPGDINQSGATNATDIVWARIESGQSGQIFADLDGSGAVDGNDVSAVRQNIGAMLPTTDPVNPAYIPALVVVSAPPAIDITATSSAAVAPSVSAALTQAAIINAPPPTQGGHDPAADSQSLDQISASGLLSSGDPPTAGSDQIRQAQDHGAIASLATIAPLLPIVPPLWGLGNGRPVGSATSTDPSSDSSTAWAADSSVADWVWTAAQQHKHKIGVPAVNELARRGTLIS